MQTLQVGSSGSVVVEIPDHVQAVTSAGSPGGTRDTRAPEAAAPANLEPAPTDAALAGALAASGFELIADLGLAPAEGSAGMRADPGEAPRVRVAVGASESAILLVEGEGGVFGWMRPDEADGDGRRGVPGEVTFTLSGSAAPARRGSLLGWLAEVLTRPVRVRVLKFIVRLTIDVAVDRIEGGNPTGLVVIADKVPERWRPGPRAVLPAAPQGRPARVLLLVHGTFSSTAGSFGQMVAHPDGEAFLDAAFAFYDAVLGFDHKTLAETVETNAEAFADALAGLPAGAEVDAVAFSRGGLVLRVLAEEVFPARRPDVRFRKAVFVGCTNAGTHLAEPDNWDALVDLYTNAIMAASRVVTALFGGTLDPLVSLGIKTVGEFVQFLAQVGINDRRVPGLASMQPDGATVKRLNAAKTVIAQQPAYYAVTSNFAPRFEPSKGITRELAQLLLDKVTNDLWDGASNDLVVDTNSMSTLGARASFLEAGGIFAFGDGELVYHTIYFCAGQTCRHLIRSLDLHPAGAVASVSETGVSVGGERELEEKISAFEDMIAAIQKLDADGGASDVETRAPSRPHRGGSGSLSEIFAEHSGRGSHIGSDEGGPFPGHRGGLEGAVRPDDAAPEVALPEVDLPDFAVPDEPLPDPAATETEAEPFAPPPPPTLPSMPEPVPETPRETPLTCNVAATMPEAPSLGLPAELEVTISREVIATPAGAAHAQGVILAQPERKLRVQVVGKSNCAIVGVSEEEIDPPARGAPASLVFQVRGKAAGPAEVWVNVFQGALRLTRLVVQPHFVADGLVAVAAPLVSQEADPPLMDLRIYEEMLPNDMWRLRFAARCDDLPGDLAFDNEYVGEEIRINKTVYVKELYKDLEQAWAETDGAFDSLMKLVRAAGIEMFRTLFPQDLQKLLWDNRERIGSIQVFSREPSIPWEVAHLVEPGKPVPLSGGLFLAELGLTRWSTNVGLAPVRLRLRAGKALYCAPDYVDLAYRLKHVPAEVEMVKDLLGAAAVDGHRDPVLKVLAREEGADYDLLHFACHGSSDPDRVWDAGLLLGGFVRGGRVAKEELTVNEVRTYANLGAGGARPIVFLNACQSGVGGYGLSGAGGLAQAFVQGGAGLFIGSLWSIGDRSAVTFSKTFYEELKAGRTVARAVRAARETAKTEKDSTWLAYTVYGHPYARVSA